MHTLELLLNKERYEADDWQKSFQAIAELAKGTRPFSMHIVVQGNLLRFFIQSDKDLSGISNGLEGFMLTPAEQGDLALLELPHAGKLGLLRLPTGGNIFDLREQYKVRKGLELTHLVIDVQRIGHRLLSKLHVYFRLGSINQASHRQLTLVPYHLLAIDYGANAGYMKKSQRYYLNIEKSLNLMVSDPLNALLEVDSFPYLSGNYHLPLRSFEFDRHGLILGQSGSGKSKFIELLISRINQANMQDYYRVIVVDPHASIAPELAHIPSQQVVDFSTASSDIFPSTTDATAATELSAALFRSLLGPLYNAYLERVLRFTLFTLYTGQTMTFPALRTFLMDIEYRKEVLKRLDAQLPTTIQQFFATDFNDMVRNKYNQAVEPIISLIDEMAFLPGVNQPANISLAQTIQNRFLTVFSLNKIGMGEKVVKTVAGLLIQSIFQLAQSRVFDRKLILIIDEVSVIQNPTLASILSEARKFNLSVILAQQYLTQVDEELRNSIFTNTYNYFIFKVSESDARLLEGGLQIELPNEILQQVKDKGLKEQDVRIKILTQLNSRECLVRLYANGMFYPCIKARTIDVSSVKGGYNGG